MQNILSSLELVIQDSIVMCKILHIIFRRFANVWHNNLEPSFIKGFSKLYVKSVPRFSISIPVKTSPMKLFGVT